VLCLLLPAVPDLSTSGLAATVTFEFTPGAAPAAPPVAASTLASLGSVMPWIVALGIAARLLWLAAGVRRLRRLRARSQTVELPPDLEALRQTIAPAAVVRATE